MTCSDGNYMFKVNNRNTRTRCEICLKLRQNKAPGSKTLRFKDQGLFEMSIAGLLLKKRHTRPRTKYEIAKMAKYSVVILVFQD